MNTKGSSGHPVSVISRTQIVRALPFFGVVTLVSAHAAGQSETSPGDPEDVANSQTDDSSLRDTVPPVQLSAVAVRITLSNSVLQESEILQALANEFRAPVVKSDGAQGLLLVVEGAKLDASYRDAEGQVIERKLDLPRDRSAQLDTIALLSGNLARDEAGELLAALRAEQDDEATLPENPEPPPTSDSLSESEDTAAGEDPPQDPESEEGLTPEKDQETASEVPETGRPPRPELPIAEFSVMAWPGISFPEDLHNKTNFLHLGLFYSDLGSVRGFAANLLALRNRGQGKDFSGEGVELAIIWVGSEGWFQGFHGAGVVSTGQGGIEGVQAGGVFSFQKNETLGAQLAGAVSVSMSDIEGGQVAGVFSGTWGNIVGFQGAGAVSAVSGDMEGAQLAGAVSVVGGLVDGFQAAPFTYAGRVDGFQLGMVNVAQERTEGFQLAGVNYAGDVHGTQIGLLNIGGNVTGAQIGFVNVAKDVDGIAIAPLNIIPGIRNQIVAYGSWAPAPKAEGTPAGPLVHLGLKFMPEPFYSQVTFGVGAEAEECPTGLLPGDAGCSGNGVLLAPGFAVGGRGQLTDGLFLETDVQYQFESTFDSSLAHRHAVLGRAALGYEFSGKFGVFAGGGPRLDVPADAQGNYGAVRLGPHVFAGTQFF